MAKEEKVAIIKTIRKESAQDINWCTTMWSSLLEDTTTHDVTFKTSDGGSVSGHRLIVAASSPVFHAMLYGNMKEGSGERIDLPSVNTETCRALLTFIYTGKFELISDNCLNILEAAHYLNVSMLERKSADFISALLDTENCCRIAIFAYNRKINFLLEKCLKFIFANTHKVIKEANFNSLPSDLILRICESSDLRVLEIDLFLAIVEWYKQQQTTSNVVIKSIFQEIRYPLISGSDLLEKVRPTNLADTVLYTSALEHHIMPNKYIGPENQLIRRKMQELNFINFTSSATCVGKDGEYSFITKIKSNKWDGLCAAQVYPTEQCPVHFKLLLKQSYSDRSGVQIAVRSGPSSSLSAGTFFGGIDATDLAIGEEVDCVISLKGKEINTTIGQNTMTTTKAHEMVHLCVYLYYINNTIYIC